MAYYQPGAGRLFLFALSTSPHCRAARKMLAELKAPFDGLDVDLLPEPEREPALAELGLRNPAQTFPTLLGGARVAAGPLPDDFRRLAARFAPEPGFFKSGPLADDVSDLAGRFAPEPGREILKSGPLSDDARSLAGKFAPEPGPGFFKSGSTVSQVAAEERHETLAPAQAAQGYLFNPDRAWTLETLAGLLVNEARYGYGSCPGRLATGRPERDRAIICPCAFRAEDVAKYGRCHCHLYFSPGAAGGGRVPPVPDRWLR